LIAPAPDQCIAFAKLLDNVDAETPPASDAVAARLSLARTRVRSEFALLNAERLSELMVIGSADTALPVATTIASATAPDTEILMRSSRLWPHAAASELANGGPEFWPRKYGFMAKIE
jgi:hypothetical protein